ncbi:hypothetical protein BST21_19525 [Mycolicibacterium celeriflavum]|nr:hypothetical protein BST21_19525 [Mycolicibacterium celeriflavum]
MIAAHFAHHGVRWVAVDGSSEMLQLFDSNTRIGAKSPADWVLVKDDLLTTEFAQLPNLDEDRSLVALLSFVLTSLPDDNVLTRLLAAVPEVSAIVIADIHPLYTATHPRYSFSLSEEGDFDLMPRAVFPDILADALKEAGFERQSEHLVRKPEKENPYAFVHTFVSNSRGASHTGDLTVETEIPPPLENDLSDHILRAEGRKYEALRREFPAPGDERTRQMYSIVNRVRVIAAAAAASAAAYAETFLRSNGQGDRIVGMALVQGALLTDQFADIVGIYRSSQSAFEEIQALQTLQAIADRLQLDQRLEAVKAIEIKQADQSGRYAGGLGPIPLLTDQILEAMRPPPGS